MTSKPKLQKGQAVPSRTRALKTLRRYVQSEAYEPSGTYAPGASHGYALGVHGKLAEVHLPSAKSVARALAVGSGRVYRRIKEDHALEQGIAVEAALSTRGNPRAKQPVTVGDVEYDSVQEACDFHGVLAGTYQYRRRQGWTVAEALGVDPRPQGRRRPSKKAQRLMPPRRIVVADRVFASLREAARARNLPVVRVSQRLRKGWTMEQALDFEPPPVHERAPKSAKPITVAGVTYPSLAAACRALGANEYAVRRLLRRKVPILQAFAVGVATDPRSHPVTIDTIEFESLSEACRFFEVNEAQVRKYQEEGMPIEEALKLAVGEKLAGGLS